MNRAEAIGPYPPNLLNKFSGFFLNFHYEKFLPNVGGIDALKKNITLKFTHNEQSYKAILSQN